MVNIVVKKLREITERKSIRKKLKNATSGTKTKIGAPPGGPTPGPGSGSGLATDAYER